VVEVDPVVVFAGVVSLFVSVFVSGLVSLFVSLLDELEPSESELLVLDPPEPLLEP
jgi:hypothetical protein